MSVGNQFNLFIIKLSYLSFSILER